MGFMNDLNDMFNKGAVAAGDVFNKGASAASRIADTANLRFKQGELDRRWKDACAELGESLIETVKGTPELLENRDAIIAALDSIAEERAHVAAELDRIAAEAQASRQSAAPRTCPECGGTVSTGANFCMHCGHAMPIDVEPEPEPEPQPVPTEPSAETTQVEEPAEEKKPE